MKSKLIYSIFIIALLISCQSDLAEFITPGDPSRISFDVSITESYPQSQLKTRGTPQIGSTAYETGKITVQAFDQTSLEDEKKDFVTIVSKSSGVWTSLLTKTYDNLAYNFYAYASDMAEITHSENENGLSISAPTRENPIPTITYTVPSDVQKQPDLLIGDQVENKTSGRVSLSMYHALSCVGFVATSKHIGNTRKVKSVTLKKVYKTGTTSIGKVSGKNIEWTVTGKTDFNFIAGMETEKPLDSSLDNIANNLTYLMKGDGYLMMVPQKLPEGAQVIMEIWDGEKASSIHTITYDIPPTTWEPGKKYMYYFDEPVLDGVATYYEQYLDGTLGLYYYDGTKEITTLNNTTPITDAGYGLLVPASTYTQYPSIYLGLATEGDDPKDKATSNGSIAAQLDIFTDSTPLDCVLYPLSQHLYPYSRTNNQRKGFKPYYTDIPIKMEAGVSETGSGKPINTRGYFLPHFAKGIYETNNQPPSYLIRTPIQMRNISYQTRTDGGGLTIGKTYTQDLPTLDFTLYNDRSVYGNDITNSSFYKESIVIGGFGGTYKGADSAAGKATISGLIINTSTNHEFDTGLFEWVTSDGSLKKVETAASCIYICAPTLKEQRFAGIAAKNDGTIIDAINRAAITNTSTQDMKIAGVVGLNTNYVKNCENWGVINNQSNHASSTTGGIVAINEKWYGSWIDLPTNIKNIFKSLQYGDFTGDMEANYPGALISTCKNYARVIGAACTGGIVAYNNAGGVVYTCVNSADIRNNGKLTSQIMMGGIAGLQQCGLTNTKDNNPNKTDPPKFFSTIQNCLNTGNITATSGVLGNSNLAIGGIVGNNDFAKPDTMDGYEIEAYGKVNQCAVHNATISGYYSDTGGIVGLNSGSVNRSLCYEVQIRGIFGVGKDEAQRNSAGGIIGTNNNYVGNCLFTHTSTSSPISSAPIWSGSSSSGGIVGINNSPSIELKSGSGYVQKCIFAAVAPINIPIGYEIGTFAPIAGFAGGYLYRDSKNRPHLQTDIDGTTGATPIYTLDDNYYTSGNGINFTNGNIVFPNEPSSDVAVAPFTTGRYPYGQTRFSQSEMGILPLNGWYGTSWERDSRPPTLINSYSRSYTLPQASGAQYILGALVKAIKDQNDLKTSGSAIFNPSGLQIANTVRVSLSYMTEEELTYVTAIEGDLSNVTFLSNKSNGYGSLFFSAPIGWKFDSSQPDNPNSYKMTIKDKEGKTKSTYYYCLVNRDSGKKIKMIRQ